jgi:hypothetical protein
MRKIRINTCLVSKNNSEVIFMAKAGMRRPDPREPHGTESNKKMRIPKNDQEPVPEIQGKAKAGHRKAKPL